MAKAKDYGYDFSKFEKRDLDYWLRINSYASASYYEWKNSVAEEIAKESKYSTRGVFGVLAGVASGVYDKVGNTLDSTINNDTLVAVGMFSRRDSNADPFDLSKSNEIKELVISWKGSDDLADFFRDGHPAGPGKALQSAKEGVFDSALKQLAMNINKCDKVVITGHSLGGFLASEFVLYVKEKMGDDWWKENSKKMELSTVDTIGLSNEFLRSYNSQELSGLTQRHLVVDGAIAEKSRDSALIKLLANGNMLHSPQAVGFTEVVPKSMNFASAHSTSNLRVGLMAELLERNRGSSHVFDIPSPSSVGKIISLKQGIGLTKLEERDVPIYPNPSF